MAKIKNTKIIGIMMLIVACLFIIYAFKHPEAGFPWSNQITYILYGCYLLVTFILFLTSNKIVPSK